MDGVDGGGGGVDVGGLLEAELAWLAGGAAGELDEEELDQMFTQCGITLSTPQCRQVIAYCDADRNGTVSLRELRWLLTAKENVAETLVSNKQTPIKRSTRQAVCAAKQHRVRLWKESHLKNKWNRAGHVIRMDKDRIARRAVEWRDSRWQDVENLMPDQLRIRRPGRKRWFRWEDELHRYAKHCGLVSWQAEAESREVWQAHCDDFVHFIKR